MIESKTSLFRLLRNASNDNRKSSYCLSTFAHVRVIQQYLRCLKTSAIPLWSTIPWLMVSPISSRLHKDFPFLHLPVKVTNRLKIFQLVPHSCLKMSNVPLLLNINESHLDNFISLTEGCNYGQSVCYVM